jgi:hypothetical protein
MKSRLSSNQMPGKITGISRETFETLAPEMGVFSRVLLSNLWLTEPLVRTQLESQPSTNALLRTTTLRFAVVDLGHGTVGMCPSCPKRGFGLRIRRQRLSTAAPASRIRCRPGLSLPSGSPCPMAHPQAVIETSLVAEGLSPSAIAAQLGLSRSSVCGMLWAT